MSQFWSPVYTDKKGNELLLVHPDYIADNEADARSIRIGTMMVECVILGLKVSTDVREFDQTNLPHIPGHLMNHGGHFPIPVAIIGGPAFTTEPNADPERL